MGTQLRILLLALLLPLLIEGVETKVHRGVVPAKIGKFFAEGFLEHDLEVLEGPVKGEPVCFYAEEGGEILSAIACEPFLGAFHIRNVLTKKECRGKGHAAQLMGEVFRYAEEMGYPFIWVETLSFQAPEFYKKLGFVEEFRRDGYDYGQSFHYLKKETP